MTPFKWRQAVPAIPALVIILLTGALGLWIRFVYAPQGGDGAVVGPQRVDGFVGWVGFLFLLDTVAIIVWSGGWRFQSHAAASAEESVRTAVAGFILLAVGSLVMLGMIGVAGGFLGWAQVARLWIVLCAWLMLWSTVAWRLCRWGAGPGIVLTLAAAMILLAGPIVLVPMARAAGAASAWQGRIAESIALGCPMLGAVEAMRPALRIEWAQLPTMYAYSGLGQDIPLTLPPWWANAVVYVVPAGLMGIFLGLRSRRIVAEELHEGSEDLG